MTLDLPSLEPDFGALLISFVEVLTDNSKEFYREDAKFLPEWKELDNKLCGMDL